MLCFSTPDFPSTIRRRSSLLGHASRKALIAAVLFAGLAGGTLIAPTALACAGGWIEVNGSNDDWCPTVSGVVRSSDSKEIEILGGSESFSKLELRAINDPWTVRVDASAAFDNTSTLQTGQYDDTFEFSERLLADYLNIESGGGNDRVNVVGAIGQVSTGDGNDVVNVSEIGIVGTNVLMGTGQDQITISEGGYVKGNIEFVGDNASKDILQLSGRVDGDLVFGHSDDTFRIVAPGQWRAPVGGMIRGGKGTDTLILDGSEGSDSRSGLNLDKLSEFEGFVKMGTNTWSVDNSAAMSFEQGLQVQTGGLKSNGSTFIATDVVNEGVMSSSDSGYWEFLGGSEGVTFDNRSTGVVDGKVSLSRFDDTLINAGQLLGTFDLGAGDDLVRNSGKLDGKLILGDGSDQFITENGIYGAVDLGGDTDILVLHAAISEGSVDGSDGFDIIELTGEGDTIAGINTPGSGLYRFEQLLVNQGTWNLGSTTDLTNLTLRGTQLTLTDAITVQGPLVVEGGKLIANKAVTATQGTTTAAGTVIDLHEGLTGNLLANGDVYINTTEKLGTLAIDGDIKLGKTSRLFIEVDDTANTSDRLNVTGNIEIEDNAQLIVNNMTTDKQTIEHTIVTAGGTRTGQFTTKNTGTTTYKVEYRENGDVVLVTNYNYNLVTPTPGTTGTVNQLTTATAFQTMVNANKADAGLRAALDDVAATNYGYALEELNGETHYLMLDELRTQATVQEGIAMHRLSARDICGTLEGRPESTCRAPNEGSLDFWAEGLYGLREYQNDKASFEGKYTNVGTIIGVDSRLSNSILGLYAGYNRGTAEASLSNRAVSDAKSLTTTSNQGSVGAYARVPILYANLDGTVGYSHGWNESQRTIRVVGTEGDKSTFSEDVKSTFDAQTWNGRVGISQEYRTSSGLEFEPGISTGFNVLMNGSLDETQKSDATCVTCLNLTWKEQVDYSVGANIDLRQNFATPNGVAIVPYVGLGVNYEIDPDHIALQSEFKANTGTNFDIVGYERLDRLEYSADFGLSVETDEGLIGYGEYGATFVGDKIDHLFHAGARMKF